VLGQMEESRLAVSSDGTGEPGADFIEQGTSFLNWDGHQFGSPCPVHRRRVDIKTQPGHAAPSAFDQRRAAPCEGIENVAALTGKLPEEYVYQAGRELAAPGQDARPAASIEVQLARCERGTVDWNIGEVPIQFDR